MKEKRLTDRREGRRGLLLCVEQSVPGHVQKVAFSRLSKRGEEKGEKSDRIKRRFKEDVKKERREEGKKREKEKKRRRKN